MTERLISFNGPMACSIGLNNKTQTRRPMRNPPFKNKFGFMTWKTKSVIISAQCGAFENFEIDFPKAMNNFSRFSPFGSPGDIILVREPAKVIAHEWREIDGIYDRAIKAEYSDGEVSPWIHRPARLAPVAVGKGMPNGCFKEACRTRCKVKRVWVERVQDITEEGAKAEGCWQSTTPGYPYWHSTNHPVKGTPQCWVSWQQAMEKLWSSCYPGSWDRNDWVWCCEFEVIT